MIIGSLKELNKGEERAAISPETCIKLKKMGFTVLIEKDLGVSSK